MKPRYNRAAIKCEFCEFIGHIFEWDVYSCGPNFYVLRSGHEFMSNVVWEGGKFVVILVDEVIELIPVGETLESIERTKALEALAK